MCLLQLLIFFVLKGDNMKESSFQGKLIKDIENRFPGSIVMKMDANYKQGFPDLMIFYRTKWAALECKKDKNARHQPNQDYYVNKLNEMSFASFISPENKEEILNGLAQIFES